MRGLPYFFLSYAHSAPSSEMAASSEGSWLTPPDLCRAVAAQERLQSADGVGFIDMRIPPGVDWNAAATEALGNAKVLVPLYSPSYFNKSWNMRERESFRLRLTQAGVEDVMRYIVPVLWTPFEPWRLDEDIKFAQALSQDVPEYLENGMRALEMLMLFRPQYEEMVRRVATRIVDRAKHNLQPSSVPKVPELAPRAPEFIVAVLTADGAARLWRPFGDRQALPIGEYSASVAERLGSATLVDDFAKVSDMLQRRPALIIVDPWMVGNATGLVDVLPRLITQARGRFLKHSAHNREAGPPIERYTLRSEYIPPVANGRGIDE